MRGAYRLLSQLGDLLALLKGPAAFGRRKVRQYGHRTLARTFRRGGL